jgi:RNA polymerase-binding transcription factor DksA
MPRATRSTTTKKTARAAPSVKKKKKKTATTTKAAGTKRAAATKGTAAKKVVARKARKATPATKTAKAAKATKAAKAVPATKVGGTKRSGRATKTSSVLDRFLEGQRAALLEERKTYTRQATSLRAEAEQLAADREPGDVQFDEESGQGDSMNVERERDLVLSAQALSAVEDIDRALARIEAGSYGVCERCGEAIPRERLRALPHASLCVKCKSGGLTRR